MNVRVLVIDDDPDIAEMLDITLSVDGFDVRTARSVGQALGLLQEYTFDVILCDWMMPGGGGDDFLRTFRKTNQNTSVVILTAGDLRGIRATAAELGANLTMSKPFNSVELSRMLRDAAESTAAKVRAQRSDRDLHTIFSAINHEDFDTIPKYLAMLRIVMRVREIPVQEYGFLVEVLKHLEILGERIAAAQKLTMSYKMGVAMAKTAATTAVVLWIAQSPAIPLLQPVTVVIDTVLPWLQRIIYLVP